jgi:hypothetical protein
MEIIAKAPAEKEKKAAFSIAAQKADGRAKYKKRVKRR